MTKKHNKRKVRYSHIIHNIILHISFSIPVVDNDIITVTIIDNISTEDIIKSPAQKEKSKYVYYQWFTISHV